MITTTPEFENVAQSTIRPLALDARVSWSKKRSDNVQWFTLDSSQLDGTDILATNDNDPIQLWDAYEWDSVREDVIGMSWERSVEFPYNVQSAICDLTLNNTHQRYTYTNEQSPYFEQILPKRPMRTFAGFVIDGTPSVVPVFVGLTQSIPKYSGTNDSTATLTAMDFLSEIGNMSLNQTVVLRDVRTDIVIAQILDQFGLDPAMYSLSEGSNIIPFAYFAKGKNAGNALRELVQAENGSLWLNEQGIIRFEPRGGSIAIDDAMTFRPNDIIEIKPSQANGIINRVRVSSEVRAVQDFQPIFSASNDSGFDQSADDDPYRCSRGTTVIWLKFDDPIWSAVTTPKMSAEDTSNFTAVDLDGNAITSGVNITGELLGESMKLTITNANQTAVSLNWLEIWGEPAKVIDQIEYDAHDDESIEVFGENVLEITDNNYFGNYESIDHFAEDILRRRAQYSPTLTVQVKGNPALQLRDNVAITGTDRFDGRWEVVGIKSKIDEQNGYSCELTLEEGIYAFVLDRSQLDGKDLLA